MATAVVGAFVLRNLTVVWIAWPLSYLAGTLYPMFIYRGLERQELKA